MWLIDRHSDGQNTARIPLPDPLRSALVRWYVGEGSRHDEDAGITLVQQARIGEKWIACDCLAHHEAPPILTPAFLSEAETYYLRRLTSSKRPEHLADCPFFRDQATNRITETPDRQTPADPPSGYFAVLRPTPEKLSQRPEEDSSDDRTRNASVPRLARLLWRLMELSGVNQCVSIGRAQPEPSIKEQFGRLQCAAGRIEIAPGIELGRALWTHAAALHGNRVYAGLRELARGWPKGHAPQAFLTLFAHGFKGSRVYVAGNEPVTVANRVQSPSVRGNPIKGPFLVIVVAGQYPEARGYAPLRAYAQPIYSGQRFLPVDSDFERSVLRALLDAGRALHKDGLELAIKKPVFDSLTRLGPCRPDFLLEVRSWRTGEVKELIVEAMGMADEHYLASKAVAHSRMAQIAPIIEIGPRDVEAGRIHRLLATSIGL